MDEKPFHLQTYEGSALSACPPATSWNSSLILTFLQQGFLDAPWGVCTKPLRRKQQRKQLWASHPAHPSSHCRPRSAFPQTRQL